MRFPIDVVFVGRDGRVIKIVERLGGWRIAAALEACATVELAAGGDAADVVGRRSLVVDAPTALQYCSQLPITVWVGPDKPSADCRRRFVEWTNPCIAPWHLPASSRFDAPGSEVALSLESMTDRRRQPRSLFSHPLTRSIDVTIDGDVESWQDDLAVVVSTTAAVQGDEFVMQFDRPRASRPSCARACWRASRSSCVRPFDSV